ncbi:MAG: hypothetical protein JWM36_2824 [Hyphomicrobiales bacterium]|nr:hypothetical protein [Hyphomicrobiales bacterium]
MPQRPPRDMRDVLPIDQDVPRLCIPIPQGEAHDCALARTGPADKRGRTAALGDKLNPAQHRFAGPHYRGLNQRTSDPHSSVEISTKMKQHHT